MHLPTLNQKPSWHNRAGNLDRSATAELTSTDIKTFSLPVDATGQLTITAENLFDIHNHRNPLHLRGDTRTTKSNALKQPATDHNPPDYQAPEIYRELPYPLPELYPDHYRTTPRRQGRPRKTEVPTKRFLFWMFPISPRNPRLLTHEQRPTARQLNNPNKGPGRTKVLGLPPDWSQQLTIIEKRIHTTLTQRFYRCPTCNNPKRKLFLTLCTPQEYEDAQRAHQLLTEYAHPPKPTPYGGGPSHNQQPHPTNNHTPPTLPPTPGAPVLRSPRSIPVQSAGL